MEGVAFMQKNLKFSLHLDLTWTLYEENNKILMNFGPNGKKVFCHTS